MVSENKFSLYKEDLVVVCKWMWSYKFWSLSEEKAFRKAFLDLEEMMKVLYEGRNTKFQGENSRPQRGECSPREEGNKNGDKPPLSSQYSCFSTTLMQDSSAESPSKKEYGQVCTFFPHDVEDEALS